MWRWFVLQLSYCCKNWSRKLMLIEYLQPYARLISMSALYSRLWLPRIRIGYSQSLSSWILLSSLWCELRNWQRSPMSCRNLQLNRIPIWWKSMHSMPSRQVLSWSFCRIHRSLQLRICVHRWLKYSNADWYFLIRRLLTKQIWSMPRWTLLHRRF